MLCSYKGRIFPFSSLITAGWVATTTTYFGPQAFSLMSLVLIKKLYICEKVKIWEYLFYMLCLIYGANTEQMCIVLFICYGIASIYFTLKKKIFFRLYLMFMVATSSLVYTMTCPGNKVRATDEIIRWFPTYGMFDVIDKADIGISTTLKWMFLDGNILVIITCVVFAILIFKRYSNTIYRVIAIIPCIFTSMCGPLKDILCSEYPNAYIMLSDINRSGSFNASNNIGIGSGTLQFGILLLVALCISVDIILLNDSCEALLVDFVLVVSGVATRAMMGYSPTVYASSTRTYTTLFVCLLAVSIHIFANNRKYFVGNKELDVIKYVSITLIIMGLVDLAFLVVTAFY